MKLPIPFPQPPPPVNGGGWLTSALSARQLNITGVGRRRPIAQYASKPMPTHDKALLYLLKAVCPDALSSGAEAPYALREEVLGFLQQQYRIGKDMVGGAICRDDQGLSTRFDVGNRVLAVFKHGFWPDTKRMMSGLQNAIEAHLGRPGTEIRSQRFEVRIRRLSGTRTLTLFVRPFLEAAPDGYDPVSVDQADHYLQLHDAVAGRPRSSNPLLHSTQLSTLGSYREVLRLLKAWQFHEGYPLECLALELLVMTAAADPAAEAATTFTQRMKHVLRHSILMLEADAALSDPSTDEPWQDFLSPTAKQRLADRWKLMLQALQGTDSKQVLAFFPT